MGTSTCFCGKVYQVIRTYNNNNIIAKYLATKSVICNSFGFQGKSAKYMYLLTFSYTKICLKIAHSIFAFNFFYLYSLPRYRFEKSFHTTKLFVRVSGRMFDPK